MSPVATLDLLHSAFKSYLIKQVDALLSAPLKIIHYTRAEAAENILRERHLWASDIYSMNDKKELAYGIERIGQRLRFRPRIPSEIRKVFGPAFHGFDSDFMQKARKWPAYVASFSTSKELVSQWREYAYEGTGVAIAFHTHQLYADAVEVGECSLFPMIYEHQRQAAIVDDVAQLCEDRELGWSDTNRTEYWLNALSDLSIASFRFKASDWAKEQEWRLFWLSPRTNPKTRTKQGQEFRYIEVPFSADAVADVILGPNASTTTRESVCEICERVYQNVNIRRMADDDGTLAAENVP